MRLMGIFLVALALFPLTCSAAPVCFFGMVPCFLACGSPPTLADVKQAASRLRTEEYKKLHWVDKSTALVTTQLGKCLGINGWKRYRFHVWAVGTVDQASTSWDGLRTVDVDLENFSD